MRYLVFMEVQSLIEWKNICIGHMKKASSYGALAYVFIAPKASAEGACILSKMGYCYEVWWYVW